MYLVAEYLDMTLRVLTTILFCVPSVSQNNRDVVYVIPLFFCENIFFSQRDSPFGTVCPSPLPVAMLFGDLNCVCANLMKSAFAQVVTG